MPDIGSLGLDPEDVLKFTIADFAPRLPAYDERAEAYCLALDRETPKSDVLLFQGVKPSLVSFVTTVFTECKWHISPRHTQHGFYNMTGVRRDIKMIDQSEIHMIGDPDGNGPAKGGIEFCPDVLVDTFEFQNNKMRVYNYEAIKGPLFEIQRVYCAGLITRDAYRYVSSMNGENVNVYLGGDLHADSDFESVKILTGKSTRDGVYPSAFVDVWASLHRNSTDKGYTERQTDVFDAGVKIPQLVQPHRHTYFMVYGDAFGRIGTPLNIEINGNSITSSSIPFSDDYGLTMQVWAPLIRGYMEND